MSRLSPRQAAAIRLKQLAEEFGEGPVRLTPRPKKEPGQIRIVARAPAAHPASGYCFPVESRLIA